jgi:hypothetical protein
MPALSRRLFLGAGVTACGCLAVAAAFAQSPPAPSPSGQYICPPCGCSQDGAVFDKPGRLPGLRLRHDIDSEAGRSAGRPEAELGRPGGGEG